MDRALAGRRDYRHAIIKFATTAALCVIFLLIFGGATFFADSEDVDLDADLNPHVTGRSVLGEEYIFDWARQRSSQPSNSTCSRLNKRGNYTAVCAYVKANCTDSDLGYINYLEIFYCSSWLGSNRALGWTTLVCWLLFLFLCLGVISNDYFVPALTSVAYQLRIPAEVAGLTLLAFGNGVANVSGYFASVSNRTYDLAIGDAFGGSFFMVCVILASICFFGKNIKLDGYSFVRDVSFLFLASVAVYVFVSTSRFYIYESVALLVFYLIYVLYAIIFDLMRQRRKRLKEKRAKIVAGKATPSRLNLYRTHSRILKKPSSLSLTSSNRLIASGAEKTSENEKSAGSDSEVEIPVVNARQITSSPSKRRQLTKSTSGRERVVEEEAPENNLINDALHSVKADPLRSISSLLSSFGNPGTIIGRTVAADLKDDEEEILAPPLQGETAEDNAESDGTLIIPNLHLYQEGMEEELKEIAEKGAYVWTFETWKESFYKLNLLGKAYYIFTYPMNIPLFLTIPTTRWNRALALASLVLGWPVIFAALNMTTKMIPKIGVPYLSVFAIAAALLMVFLFFLTRNESPPKFRLIFLAWGFVICVAWNYMIANEVVNVLQAVGRILSIADILLGATILTWGNSVSDFVADSSLAYSGQARVAMGALYGGPMFSTYTKAAKRATNFRSRFNLA